MFQCKNVDTLSKEVDLPTSQLLGLFNTLVRKMTSALRSIHEKSIEQSLTAVKNVSHATKSATNGSLKSLNAELEEAAEELKKKQKEDLKQLQHLDLTSYQVGAKVTSYRLDTQGKVSKSGLDQKFLDDVTM